ncbi:unnamed protein product [Ilex paraguariensis]|uniref:Protein TILLER ANGLE CONTROL 1 n=1 Tax=Ilex paraguariensis TaxID=185542 RepID=A0ABC8QWU7_9AQUA
MESFPEEIAHFMFQPPAKPNFERSQQKQMKIFNWVHRRFNHKDGFGGDVKKSEFVSTGTDRQALLGQVVVLADVLDGWREGVLTIGTFGFDPLKDFNQHKEWPPITDRSTDKDNEEEEDEEQEAYSIDSDSENNDLEDEANPLVFTALKRGLGKDHIGSDCDQNGPKLVDLITINNIIDSINPVSPRPHDQEHGFNSNFLEYDKMKKKERTTLADLFSADADADVHAKPDQVKILQEISKKPAPHAKNGLSFAKKLIPRVGEDSRPIQKLHRLMTKMLKRKIHPDLEGKIQTTHSGTKPSVVGLVVEEYEPNESVSLLQTQDGIV